MVQLTQEDLAQIPEGVRGTLLTFAEVAAKIPEVPEISNQEEFAKWTSVLQQAKEYGGKVDEFRKWLKAPSLEQGKRIDSVLMPIVKAFESFERTCKARLAEHHKRVQLENREASSRAAEAVQRGDYGAALAERLQDTPKAEGLTMRKRWKWRASKTESGFGMIPRKYLKLDDEKIKEFLKHLPEDTEPLIPGVHFEEDFTPAVSKS